MRSLTEMAVSCVIVFALLNYVTATPHDYAKTGAIAKGQFIFIVCLFILFRSEISNHGGKYQS